MPEELTPALDRPRPSRRIYRRALAAASASLTSATVGVALVNLEGPAPDAFSFVGRRLVQLDLHPTLMLDGAQPNLLDPAGDGAALLADVRTASARIAAR
jgi:hypothetical protein